MTEAQPQPVATPVEEPVATPLTTEQMGDVEALLDHIAEITEDAPFNQKAELLTKFLFRTAEDLQTVVIVFSWLDNYDPAKPLGVVYGRDTKMKGLLSIVRQMQRFATTILTKCVEFVSAI